MSTETTNKKIKIDNGTTFGKTYTDKAIDAKLPTDLIASANKLSLGVGSIALGNGINLNGFTYDEATKTLKASGGESIPIVDGTVTGQSGTSLNQIINVSIPQAQNKNFILHLSDMNLYALINYVGGSYNATIDDEYNTDSLIHTIIIVYGIGTSITINSISITNNYFINGTKNGDKITIELPSSPFYCQIIDNNENLYGMYQMQFNANNNLSYGYGSFDFDTNSISYLTNKGSTTGNDFTEYKITIPQIKTISLFGKHSILVPKDSADTNILPLPADASTSTYVLKAVNGVIKWVKES